MAGRLEFLAVAQALQRLIEDPAARASRGTLLIIQDADAFASLTEMKPILALVRHWAERSGDQRCAVVTPSAVTAALAQTALPALKLNVSAIRSLLTESEAIRWLDAASLKLPRNGTGMALPPATASTC